MIAVTTPAPSGKTGALQVAPDASEQPSPVDADAPFPSDTASDVVSYSDHVALVTALSEVAVPDAPDPTRAVGVRVVMKNVTFRVDHVLWSRLGAPRAPAAFSARWWGWIDRDGRHAPFIVRGAPTVFVGAQYVVPISYEGTAFTVIQPFAASDSTTAPSRSRSRTPTSREPFVTRRADGSLTCSRRPHPTHSPCSTANYRRGHGSLQFSQP